MMADMRDGKAGLWLGLGTSLFLLSRVKGTGHAPEHLLVRRSGGRHWSDLLAVPRIAEVGTHPAHRGGTSRGLRVLRLI